jgi:hypothetical protein
MISSGTLVQVARPSLENSLADGVVGFAWLADQRSQTNSVCLYRLKPEEQDYQLPVEGLLFSEAELEALT